MMALHLLKLIWNRKRTNLLIITEILLSFIVLAAVSTLAVYYAGNMRKPLGFSYDRIWDVQVRVPRGIDAPAAAERTRLARMQRILDLVRQMPEVEAADHVQLGLFRNWTWNSDMQVGGRSIDFNGNRGGDALADTLSIQMVEGRWFSREDDGQRWDAVVINRSMAREIFGDEPAAGRTIPRDADESTRPRPPGDDDRELRVVGVMEDFRQYGELGAMMNYMMVRNDLAGASVAPAEGAEDARPRAQLPGTLVVRVQPGITAAFEERLVRALQTEAPDWGFTMRPMENVRANMRKQTLTPLAVAGLLALFLLVMVALGLSGVLWQNVTQRIRELGLRRAKGADRRRIRRQILGELTLMTAISVTGGLVFLLQVPMFGWLGPVSTATYATSLVVATIVIVTLTMICGLYPSLLATRVPPAEALRYE
jgi:putative ABC transport system permease protein